MSTNGIRQEEAEQESQLFHGREGSIEGGERAEGEVGA